MVRYWSGSFPLHLPYSHASVQKKNLSKAISKEGYTIFWSPFGILKFNPDLMGWFLPIDVSFRAEIYPTEPLLLRKKSRCFHVFDRTCIMNKWAMLLMQFFSKNVMTWGRTNCNGMTPQGCYCQCLGAIWIGQAHYSKSPFFVLIIFWTYWNENFFLTHFKMKCNPKAIDGPRHILKTISIVRTFSKEDKVFFKRIQWNA